MRGRGKGLTRGAVQFVECTKTGIFSVVWRCKPLQHKLNDCFRPYTTEAVLNQMKRDYVAQRRPELQRARDQ